jgi:hypothetical protein
MSDENKKDLLTKLFATIEKDISKTVQECLFFKRPVFIDADNIIAHSVTPANGKTFHFKELYKLLNVDMIQIVELADGNLLVLDEEGKLKDEAIVNEIATKLWRVNRMSEAEVKKMGEEYEKRGIGFIGTFDSDLGFDENTIVGNVLICDKKYLEDEDEV